MVFRSIFGDILQKNLGLKKGHHPSEETRKKMSESHVGLQAGEKHPRYSNGFFVGKYGTVIGHAIQGSLNRDYPIPIFFNKPFKDCSFHHLTKECGLFIPRDIHYSIWHRLDDPKSMKKINRLVDEWLIQDLERNLKM